MAEYKNILTVPASAESLVITHSLDNVNAVLTACTPGGWFGRPRITARTANTITVEFGNQAPAGGTRTCDVEVKTP